MAAAPSTFSTPRASSWVLTMPEVASTALARLEASNSVGRVTSWNTTTAAKKITPSHISPLMLKIRPMMNGKYHMADPIWVSGTSWERTTRGAYFCASWMQCPASWAATATADTERPSWTSGDRRSVLLRGS